ncbi:Hypothetical protein, conserved [Brucella abortus str. 2308 A]|nr:Hypothetical protein, conserved [Brucella abortus str. 2308 A]
MGGYMDSRVLKLTAALFLGAALAGCSTAGGSFYTASYSSVSDAGYAIPAIPSEKIPAQYRRQVVKYATDEKPGTIIVDTREKFLYLIMPEGKAVRYGIGVGRRGFEWSGTARVAMKREWPTWTPPSAMIKRQPELAKYRNGMDPGLRNPLGARALYLYNKGGDTGYRLHGTPEWWSIGKAMSSGCIRLMNQDIIDLYNRVEQGAKVVVKQ